MTTRGSLLLIEDDRHASECIRDVVVEICGPDVSLIQPTSESEFLAKWDSIRHSKPLPAAVILDARLPWEGFVPATGPQAGDVTAAGIRILAHIRADSNFSAIPVLIYSANDKDRLGMPDHLPPLTTYMRKDAPDELLVDWISSIG